MFLIAVDVVYATSEYEAVSVFDGKVAFRGRGDDLCDQASDLCSIPAGGKSRQSQLNTLKNLRKLCKSGEQLGAV